MVYATAPTTATAADAAAAVAAVARRLQQVSRRSGLFEAADLGEPPPGQRVGVLEGKQPREQRGVLSQQ